MTAKFKALGEGLAKLAANPFAYVIGFAFLGAVAIVSGVTVMAGAGMALVTAGVFLIAAASYITKGLKPNG